MDAKLACGFAREDITGMAMDGGGIEYEALTKDDSWRDVQILERQPSRSGFRCACGSRDSRRPRAGEHTR
ncbi:MAG: hypothetical protein ACPIOQ_40340, partial [Promethearchaeia archaeon]